MSASACLFSAVVVVMVGAQRVFWKSTLSAIDTRACKHLYLDIGSNIGVQVRKLFEPEKYSGAPFARLFDQKFGSVDKRRKEVCAIGFEANPHKTAELARIEKCYNAQGWRVWFMTETLFGVSQRRTPFFSDNDTANEEWASSIYDHTGRNAKFTVQEIDGAEFLTRFAQPVRRRGGVVMAKMDIEGAEFTVLPHLLSTHALCQATVEPILIEWHSRYVPQAMHVRAKLIQSAIGAFVGSQMCAGTSLLELDDETYLHDGAALPCAEEAWEKTTSLPFRPEQWAQSANFSGDNCVASNTFVRELATTAYTLAVSLLGDCTGVETAVCVISAATGAPVTRQAVASTQGESRYNSYMFPAESAINQVRLMRTVWLDCGPIPAAFLYGNVSVIWPQNSFANLQWQHQSPQQRVDAVVCSRLYIDESWLDTDTDRLLAWLNWTVRTAGIAANRAVQVELFITNIEAKQNDSVRRVLNTLVELAVRNFVRLYDWTPPTAFDMPTHLWQYGQLSYTSECIARNEHRARYIIPIDIDEFLFLPASGTDRQDVIGALDELGTPDDVLLYVSSIIVSGHHACNKIVDELLGCHKNEQPNGGRGKYIIRPNQKSGATVFLPPNIHSAAPTENANWLSVPPSVLHLNHFRRKAL